MRINVPITFAGIRGPHIALLLIISFYIIACNFRNFFYKSNSFTWPIALQHRNGIFELKLKYSVGTDATKLYRVPESKDLEMIEDYRWRRPIDPLIYLAHPQPIDLQDTLARLITQEPIVEPPINGDTFRYLSIPKSICFPRKNATEHYNLIVIMKSDVLSFKRRSIFRQVYKNGINASNFHMIFAVGVPRSQADGIFKRGNNTVVLNSRGNGNLISPERASQLLKHEMSEHDDLLVGAYEDTYFNLSIKTHYSFTWVATMCRETKPSIIFIDEDVSFSPNGLGKFFSSMKIPTRRRLLHGRPIINGRVIRFNSKGDRRNAALKSEAPWPLYPPYLQGSYYFVGFNQVEQLTLGMLFTRYITNEDAWIGLVAARLQITITNIRQLVSNVDMFLKVTRVPKIEN